MTVNPIGGIMLAGALLAGQAVAASGPCASALDFTYSRLAGGAAERLCEHYAGQVILVVNTASECGYTPQYDGLQKVYSEYRARGFVILGFPSNDFGHQEPGSEKEIQGFCKLNYGVAFPMFSKVVVKGVEATPFYLRLAADAGREPAWNFHKYLIDRNGRVVADFPSAVTPDSAELRGAIERLL